MARKCKIRDLRTKLYTLHARASFLKNEHKRFHGLIRQYDIETTVWFRGRDTPASVVLANLEDEVQTTVERIHELSDQLRVAEGR